MFSFDGICPHCGSEKGFNAFGVSAYVISDRDYEQFPLTPTEQRIQEAREGMNLPTMPPPERPAADLHACRGMSPLPHARSGYLHRTGEGLP